MRARDRIGAARAQAIGCLVLAVSLLASLPAGAAPLGSLRLVPDSGPPSTSAGVAGREFGPSEVVDVAFDSTPVGSVKTGSGGRFFVWVQVPVTAQVGLHMIRARGRTSGITAAAPFTVRIDWPTFHATADRRGHNPYETMLDPANVSGLVPAWIAPTSDIVNTSPVVVDDVVYAGADPDIYAFDAQSGQQLWRVELPQFYLGTYVAVAYGRVYVASSGTGELFALKAATGDRLWTYQAGGAIFSYPAVDRGVVYFGANDEFTYAVNAFIGTLIWRARAGNRTPALAGDTLVAVDEFSGVRLNALDARTGALLWTTEQLGLAGSGYGPVLAGDAVYLATSGSDGNLWARDALTGEELWTATTPESLQSTPAVAGDRIYVGSNDNNLYAFEAATGEISWTAPTGDAVTSAPAVANGVVYVGSKDTRLHAFNATTGAELWSWGTGHFVADPVVVDGSVYVGSFDEHLYAFRLPPSSP